MAKAQAQLFRTASPSGWSWSFDRTDVTDGQIDNVGTATGAQAALNAVIPLIGALPGTLYQVTIQCVTLEP